MLKFAHILNPVNAPKGSELERVQPVTFASIRRSLDVAEGKVNVQVFSAQYEEDRIIIPEWITKTPNLERSLCDLYPSEKRRKLPLLCDILGRLYENSDADYFILTNADICLMPSFYVVAAEYAGRGYDAFAINRRRISNRLNTPAQLELMYAEAGEKHTGYDTFIFKRSLLTKFILDDVCVGIPFFDSVLMHNFYAFADNFRLMSGKHLTFHLGMELVKKWGDREHCRHNEHAYARVRKQLYPCFHIENFPGANLPFIKRHFKWLFNPTFHYPTMLRLDFSQLGRKRKPRTVKEVTGCANRYFEWMSRQIGFDDED